MPTADNEFGRRTIDPDDPSARVNNAKAFPQLTSAVDTAEQLLIRKRELHFDKTWPEATVRALTQFEDLFNQTPKEPGHGPREFAPEPTASPTEDQKTPPVEGF